MVATNLDTRILIRCSMNSSYIHGKFYVVQSTSNMKPKSSRLTSSGRKGARHPLTECALHSHDCVALLSKIPERLPNSCLRTAFELDLDNHESHETVCQLLLVEKNMISSMVKRAEM